MVSAKAYSPSAALVLSGAQIVLAVIIAAVTATQLDMANGDCYLNIVPGRVCGFVYSTVGFSLLFTLILAIPTLIWKRTAKNTSAPLILEASHLSLFASFWWLVLSITITIRGNQAQDNGFPGQASRGAVVAFSWIQTALFLATAVVVVVDRIQHKSRVSNKDDDASSSDDSAEKFAYTQALAHTPIS